MLSCLFCKIISRELSSAIIYEDDAHLAFLDINPVNKGHVLIVPKKHCDDFFSCDDETLVRTMPLMRRIGEAVVKGMNAQGCNITTNNGAAAGQVIFHLHWHIIPRFDHDGLKLWSGTTYQNGEMEQVAEEIRRNV